MSNIDRIVPGKLSCPWHFRLSGLNDLTLEYQSVPLRLKRKTNVDRRSFYLNVIQLLPEVGNPLCVDPWSLTPLILTFLNPFTLQEKKGVFRVQSARDRELHTNKETDLSRKRRGPRYPVPFYRRVSRP